MIVFSGREKLFALYNTQLKKKRKTKKKEEMKNIACNILCSHQNSNSPNDSCRK